MTATTAYTSIDKSEMIGFLGALTQNEERPYTEREAFTAFWAWKRFSVWYWERGYQRFGAAGIILFGERLGAVLGVKARQARNYLRAWKFAGVVERAGMRLKFSMPGQRTIGERTARRAPTAPTTATKPKKEAAALDRMDDSTRRAVEHRIREFEEKNGEAPTAGWIATVGRNITTEERDEILERADQADQAERIRDQLREQREEDQRIRARVRAVADANHAQMRARFEGLTGTVRIAAEAAILAAIPERWRGGTTNSIVLERIAPMKRRALNAFMRRRIADGEDPPLT